MTPGARRRGRVEPTLVYDGDCGFCTSCARLVERRVGAGTRVVAWQQADLAAFGLDAARARREVWWVDRDGRASGGAAAVARLLVHHGGPWRAAGYLMRVPPVSWLAAAAYRLVAANRHRMPGGTPACAPRGPEGGGR